MDQETREFLERRFDAIDSKFGAIDARFDAVDEKFGAIDDQFLEMRRSFGVVAEGLERQIQQVAEGVVVLNEKLDRETGALCQEMRAEFSEVKAMIKFSYSELDRRITTVEGEVAGLKSRLDRLEAR